MCLSEWQGARPRFLEIVHLECLVSVVPRYSTREFSNINFIDVFEPNQNMSMKGSPLPKFESIEVVGDIITSLVTLLSE